MKKYSQSLFNKIQKLNPNDWKSTKCSKSKTLGIDNNNKQ